MDKGGPTAWDEFVLQTIPVKTVTWGSYPARPIWSTITGPIGNQNGIATKIVMYIPGGVGWITIQIGTALDLFGPGGGPDTKGPQQPQQPTAPQQPPQRTFRQNFCFYTSPAGLGGVLAGVGLGMGSISWGGSLTTLGLSGLEVGSFAVGAATVGPYLAVGGAGILVARGALC